MTQKVSAVRVTLISSAAAMKKVMIVLLATMLAFSRAALSAQKIEDIPWDESHIKQLRAAGKHAMFRFFLHQKDPDNEMEWTEASISWDYAWYPIGDGKYELAVDYQSGPDIGFNTFYWRGSPGEKTKLGPCRRPGATPGHGKGPAWPRTTERGR